MSKPYRAEYGFAYAALMALRDAGANVVLDQVNGTTLYEVLLIGKGGTTAALTDRQIDQILEGAS